MDSLKLFKFFLVLTTTQLMKKYTILEKNEEFSNSTSIIPYPVQLLESQVLISFYGKNMMKFRS